MRKELSLKARNFSPIPLRLKVAAALVSFVIACASDFYLSAFHEGQNHAPEISIETLRDMATWKDEPYGKVEKEHPPQSKEDELPTYDTKAMGNLMARLEK